MTNKEAVKTLLFGLHRASDGTVIVDSLMEDDFLYAIGVAISVLMKQEEEGKNLCKCQNDGDVL